MKTCYMNIPDLESGKMRTLDCHLAKYMKERLYEEFKKVNRCKSDEDRAFKRYKAEIEEFLDKCTCEKLDHESTVTKNILDAKERRFLDQSVWKNKND